MFTSGDGNLPNPVLYRLCFGKIALPNRTSLVMREKEQTSALKDVF